MKRHWPILIVVMLAVMAVKRQASVDAGHSDYQQLTARLASLNTSGDVSDVATNTVLQMEAAELQALRDDAFRIHQLRGEVTLAQQRVGNLAPIVTNLAAKLHARTNEVENLPAPEFPPGYLPRHELADSGNATPEAALETFWWAVSTGNQSKLFAVAAEMASRPVPENPHQEDDSFTQNFTQKLQSFPGYQIVKRENSVAGQLVIGLKTAPEARVVDMILIHTNGQWLVSINSLGKAFEGDSSR